MPEEFHTPVMLGEVLDHLNLTPGQTIVDATIGTAGHSLKIIERISPGGRLVGIDRDAESLAVAKERLKGFASDCEFVYGNFVELEVILRKLKIKKIDGIIFDLGISSFQLSDPLRGFSFQNEGPLDMRLDRNSYISAYDLVNNLNQEETSSLLWNFGEERWHNRIARLLVSEREEHPISTTQELSRIVVKAIPSRYRYKYQRIHPATRTFQAVRIAVNRELEVLEKALDEAIGALSGCGRIGVISFHSLEDRIVKWNFRKNSSSGLVKIITPKPLTPQEEEVRKNPASRSSKFRVAERAVG